MKKKKIIILPLLILAAVAGVFIYRNHGGAKQPDKDVIAVSGNIEVIETETSFRAPGRVMERLVDEGDIVKAGQLIARLDPTEMEKQVDVQRGDVMTARAALADLEAGSRPEEIAAAEADVDRAQAMLDKLLAGSRPEEISAADAQVRTLNAQLDRAKSEYERCKRLYDSGVIAERELIAARTAYEAAVSSKDALSDQKKIVVEGPRKEDILQARAALRQAKEKLALVKEGPRKQTVEQARARMAQAESALSLAETKLGYVELRSPVGGVVISKNVEPGEYVTPGSPVVTIGDMNNVFLRAYINEDDLGKVKTGGKVCVSTDTYPGKKYDGRISFIAQEAEFTPKNVQTAKERVKLVYRVKVAIPNPDMELKPGMPADGEILLNEGESCK